MRVILIIGSHRTGTKLLGNFFRERFEGVESVHQYGLLRWVNVLSNLCVAGKVSRERFEGFLERRWVPGILGRDCDTYVESNGFNYLAAGYLRQRHPDTRIVHMVRDPRDYVVSYTNWIDGRMASKVANRLPWWHVSGPASGKVSAADWAAWSDFERYCWYWTYKNEFIAEKYAGDTDRYLLLRFEDLVNPVSRRETLATLLAFCGLTYSTGLDSYFEVRQNESAGNQLGHWPSWPDRLARQLHRICGPLMTEYGYGEESAWKEKLHKD